MLEPKPEVIETIVGKIKTNGMFDEMRRNCLADIDTKPAFQNLKQRVENFVNALLSAETWTPTLNKNQLRTKVRTSVMRSGMLNSGVEHILHQVVDAKMYTEFLPKISDFISENHDNLLKELAPQPDVKPTPGEFPESQDEEKFVPETEAERDSETQEEEKGQSTENVPEIPEGAASTLRTLIQSLMTTNIQSLLTMGNEGNGEEKATADVPVSGSSPSIHSSQIESFTDEENDVTSKEAKQTKEGGPRTPEEYESGNASETGSAVEHRKQTDVTSSSEYEELDDNVQEDLRKVDSDASFGSSGENLPKSDCEVVVNEGQSDEDIDDMEMNVESHDYEQGPVDEVDVNEEYENSVEEVELELAGNENVVIDDSMVSYEQHLHTGEDVAEIVYNEEESVANVHHSHREKKRRHKKHRRRRHSTAEEESDESARVATPSDRDSSDEAKEEETEHVKSKSRKKKKKKRSKKVKRSKSKARDSSQERLQWETSSEYKRSSLSPSHGELGQRHSFVPSPLGHQPIRFDDDNRSVKVEPAFAPITPHFRDPYAVDRDPDDHRPPADNTDRPFSLGPPDAMMGFPRSGFPRSPPHYSQHMHPRFSPPRFPHGHPRFSPPYSRMPYPMRPGSPPPRRYSPTFDYFRPPMRPHFDGPGPPRSPPPYQRRFSPPHQMGRFPMMPPRPHMFPGPPDERFMMRPGMSGAHIMPPGPMMRPDMPPGPPMDMRRPPMR